MHCADSKGHTRRPHTVRGEHIYADERRSRRFGALFAVAACALTLAACSGTPGDAEATDATPQAGAPPQAVSGSTTSGPAARAELEPTRGNKARGTVTFTGSGEEGVRVVANLSGLTPGEHGLHVHETGSCSAPDASSAGEHFDPLGMPHGAPDADRRHAGDLGNITANADGSATLDRTVSLVSIQGANAIVGRAVIVHAGRDDLKTQPSGDAGDRLACGVIELKM